MAAPRLVLASRSETRLRILRHAGFDPLVVPSDVDETLGDLELSVAVSELALRKASAVAGTHHEDLVLGCDSLVELDGEVLGKPFSSEEAVAWWQQMRTRSVRVWTGHALMLGGRVQLRAPAATVHFGHATDAEIECYVATGEPLGAAGAFRLDGRAAAFIESIDGDPGTVHGVSIPTLHEMLAELDVELTDLWA
jgi:septum formation protein